MIFCLFTITITGHTKENESYLSKPTKEVGNLAFAFIPMFKTCGPVIVKEVPVVLYGDFPNNLAAAISSPVYAASEDANDRAIDINIISMFGVRVKVRYCNDEFILKNKDCELVIDVEHAKQPKDCDVSLIDVIQYIICCMKINIPPKYFSSIEVKIQNGKTESKWNRFEGPLWPR